MSAYYNLFLRNWLNNRAQVSDIDLAVTKGYITEGEANTIKTTER